MSFVNNNCSLVNIFQRKWVTPFSKQCFVVIGASINIAQIGMVMGYAATLLPQLTVDDSPIPLDDDSSSWVASLPGFTLLVGNSITPTLMGKYGRKRGNIFSIILGLIGWSLIVVTNSLTLLIIARFLQGVSTGMAWCLTPITIGEYASPKNRGAFSMLMGFIMAAGTFVIHAVGSYVPWNMTALIAAIITIIDLLMVVLSPETPSWLAEHGKYEECQKVFRWLRGDDEEDELAKMIEANRASKELKYCEKQSFTKDFKRLCSTLSKKEFYKPIIIMIHLFTMGQWAGINLLAAYIVHLVDITVGKDVNTPAVVISLGIQRMITSSIAVFVIRKMKRRTMLFTTIGLNMVVLLISAGYIHAKQHDMLPFDHPAIGGLLLHLLMVTVASGSLPMPLVIAGEIFPQRFRSLSSGISSFFCSLNIFGPVKTFPYLLRDVGLSGAYCVYSAIMIYCLVVVWFMLPETKDRTLQDIEDEFKGKVSDDDLKSAVPLKSINGVDDNV